MSDETPAKRKAPATQVADMLGDMQTVLREMQTQQQSLLGGVTVLADVRDTIVEAVQVMGESVKTQAREPVIRNEEAPLSWWERWKVLGMFMAIAVVAFASGWIWHPHPAYARYDGLGRALDAALVQHYTTLPKPVQEAVTTIYAGQGLQGPAQRKGQGK